MCKRSFNQDRLAELILFAPVAKGAASSASFAFFFAVSGD
jgi:hypothetical protein